jgi:hypothetical protein
MKLAIILTILLLFAVGCSTVQEEKQVPVVNTAPAVSGIQDLMFSAQDLSQFGLVSGGADCLVENYNTSEFSPQAQYSLCNYTIASMNNTLVWIELHRYADFESLNGSYGYTSSHLFGAKGLMSENTYGDQSRFRVNSADDYGGEFNDPNMYYYHLWITKDKYLIHITSGGTDKTANDSIDKMARMMLNRFG